MPFRVNGVSEEVAFSVYPVSEGIVNPDFGIVGLLLHKETLRRFPLMYSLGAPGTSPAQLKKRTRWFSMPVPFHFRVLRAGPFLRNIAYLRRRRGLRLLLDLLAASGVGALGLGLLQPRPAPAPACERFEGWGAWAEALWRRVRDDYALIGDRSQAALQALYPEGHAHLIKLCVPGDGGQVAGWAVLTAARLRGHRYFGGLRLAGLVDMLAAPGQAEAVVRAALAAAGQAGADLLVANHSAQAWNAAFRRAGLLPWKTNFHLFLSPALQARFAPLERFAGRFYFTRGDGHGPTSLWLADYHAGQPSVPQNDMIEAF
jgi:hypothetical protein